MTLVAFINFTICIVALIASCYALRECWLRVVPPRILAWLIAPGVALHELSHAAGCLMTGARIYSITLFRPDGSGEVKHGRPLLRHPGDVIISMAPLVGCTLALWLIGWLLGSPVNFYRASTQGVTPGSFGFLGQLANLVADDLWLALTSSHWLSWRTWAFLYLSFCVAMAMAPSRQDLRNCGEGLLVLCGVALLAHVIVDWLLKLQDGPVLRFVAGLMIRLHYPFAVVALAFGLCGLVWLLTLPFRPTRR